MIRAIKIELQKLKNSPTLWITLLMPLIVFFINTYLFIQNFEGSYGRTVAVTQDPNPWRFFIEKYASTMENCLGLYILLSVGWLHSLEHRNRMWAKNLLFPISISQIIIAKITLIVIAAILIQLLFSFLLSCF